MCRLLSLAPGRPTGVLTCEALHGCCHENLHTLTCCFLPQAVKKALKQQGDCEGRLQIIRSDGP